MVQVRASNNGGDYVDPALGALGKRLKSTYPYRNYKKVGSSSKSAQTGGPLQFPLTGGMQLSLKLTGYAAPVVSIQAVVSKGAEQMTSTNLRVAKGGTVIISVPLGEDRLILAITVTVR